MSLLFTRLPYYYIVISSRNLFCNATLHNEFFDQFQWTFEPVWIPQVADQQTHFPVLLCKIELRFRTQLQENPTMRVDALSACLLLVTINLFTPAKGLFILL